MDSFRRPREAKPSSTLSYKAAAKEAEEDYVEEEDVEEEECDGFGFQGGVVKKKKVISVGSCKRRGSAAGGDGGNSPPCCQADKCSADLIGAKRYHRRHKVCEAHAKAPVVVVAGLAQRFCQQCSRFHELLEFDKAKRSCRKRLAWHNERRRKCSSETHGEDSSRHRLSCRLKSSIKGNST